LIKSTDTETVIKKIKLQKRKVQNQMDSLLISTTIPSKKILYQCHTKHKGKQHFQTSITLVAKLEKDTMKGKLKANFFDETDANVTKKILVNKTPQHVKNIIHTDQIGFISEIQG
jgi:hypothetical protein